MIEFETISLPGRESGFRKFLRHGESNCFTAEADGLAAIAATGTVCTPRVIRCDQSELVTEFVRTGAGAELAWHGFGQQLARMHSIAQPDFGFHRDNYCGATPQLNTPTADGYEFFAECRLNFQGRLARDKGLLGTGDIRQLDSLGARLPELIPRQPPSLLHGDLWRGNVLFGSDARAYVIDPACYRGWPEAELGMTTLFGQFNPAFYDGYASELPLEDGWRERLPLYNLYHLLNHLNLFGPGYYGRVKAVLETWGV